MRKAPTALLTLVAATLIGAVAQAHPELKATDPPGGGTIVGSPNEIRMMFTESLIAKFSGVELKDKGGRVIVTGTATIDPNDRKQLVVPLKQPLAPGTYDVDWHAVSVDTHKVQGHFSFSVGP